MIITLLVLYAPRLQQQLGRWYLPLVLAIVFVGSFLAWGVNVWWTLQHYNIPPEWIIDEGAIIATLFVPLIIISTQYNYKTVLAFTFLTTLVNIVLGEQLLPANSEALEYMWENSIGLFIIYAIVGFLIVRVVTGQKKERQLLTAQNIQLTHYATTVERLAISHERNRMARELHDTLAHTLSAVSVQLEALNMQLDSDHEGAKQTLQQSRTAVRNGLQETRPRPTSFAGQPTRRPGPRPRHASTGRGSYRT